MIVVADTSPICYLVLIDQIGLLPRLYDQITIPDVVLRELQSPNAPIQTSAMDQSNTILAERSNPDAACRFSAKPFRPW
ncbi:MAG: hypothetical protein ACFBSC_01395 [Microcoleaceae cyanobacterium]